MAAEDTPVPEPPAETGLRSPCVVRVSGEMDADHVEDLRAALAAALSRAPKGAEIVVARGGEFLHEGGAEGVEVVGPAAGDER